MGCGVSLPSLPRSVSIARSSTSIFKPKFHVLNGSVQEIRKEHVTLPHLHPKIQEIHNCLPQNLRQAPVRLVKASVILGWGNIKVFEELAKHEFTSIPYDEVSEEQWGSLIALSWRWNEPKRLDHTKGWSPMSSEQFQQLQKLVHHSQENSGIEFVWIDWCCVPQYGADPMGEIMRSRLYYARARVFAVLPTIHPDGYSSLFKSLLLQVVANLKGSAARSSSCKVNGEPLELFAAAVLERVVDCNLRCGQDYFGRVWTVSERLARCSFSETLNWWISSDLWLGMVLDTFVTTTENSKGADWSKFFSKEGRTHVHSTIGKCKSATVSGEAFAGLEHDMARVIMFAIEAWLTISLKETPTKPWLLMFLIEDLFNEYQAFKSLDGIFAVYAFYCFEQKGYSDWLCALQSLTDILGHALLVDTPSTHSIENVLNSFRWRLKGDIQVQVELVRLGSLMGKTNGAGALMNLAAGSPDNRMTIAQAGGIPLLVELLRTGPEEGKTQAAGALQNLAANPMNQRLIAQAGAIPALQQLLQTGPVEGQMNAVGALRNLAVDANNKVIIAQAGGILALVDLLRTSPDEGMRTHAAAALRNLAENNYDNKKAIAMAEGVAPLVELLRSGSEDGQTKAAGALWNLAAICDNRVLIANEHGIPPLVALLRTGRPAGMTQAAGALRNMAANPNNRILIAQADGIVPLVELLHTELEEAKTLAAGALRNLAEHNADNKLSIAQANGIPPLVELLHSGSQEAQTHAAAAIWNVTRHEANIATVALAAPVPGLVELLYSGAEEAKAQSAGALWSLAVDTDTSVIIIEAGAIPLLVALISNGGSEAKKNAAGALWNLMFNEVAKKQIEGFGFNRERLERYRD